MLLSIKRNIFFTKTTFLVFIRRGRNFIMLAKNCLLWSLFTIWMNQLKPEKFRNTEHIMQQNAHSGYVQGTFLIHFIVAVFVVAISEIEYDWNPDGVFCEIIESMKNTLISHSTFVCGLFRDYHPLYPNLTL